MGHNKADGIIYIGQYEVIEQALGRKYLNPNYSPPMFPKDATMGERALARVKHAGSNFVPIFVQQVYEHGPQGFAGFAGHPIYGKKKE